jgi:hypothetical protein
MPDKAGPQFSVANSDIWHTDPSRWHLEYSVHNSGETLLWLVVDENPAYQCNGYEMELGHARTHLQSVVRVYGYFTPKVVLLPSSQSWQRSLQITWPCQLSDLWSATREAAPTPGDYTVSVRVGYGLTAAPKGSREAESVEAPVLRWQQTVASPPVRMSVSLSANCNGLPTP